MARCIIFDKRSLGEFGIPVVMFEQTGHGSNTVSASQIRPVFLPT